MNVLLVEDDESTKTILEKLLTSRNHKVSAHLDAESALETHRTSKQELVVTDWMLPGMDGLELCRSLRLLSGPRLPVIIVCTSRSAAEDLEAVMAAGADDYLLKPVDFRSLSVRMALAERAVRERASRAELERELFQAQKLEAVGQLAAGIAHEINTPTQFVGDNVRFLEDSFGSLVGVLRDYERVVAAAELGNMADGLLHELRGSAQRADMEYLLEEIPLAIEQSLDGLGRIARIVGAMKEFSHPGTDEKIATDLNRAIENTVTVARNEWKYVAELEMDLCAELPLVPCHLAEFNQAILNLIVNAAHAIADVVRDGPKGKGTITVTSRRVADEVEIRIADSGYGIPPEISERVFEPFFTTKAVGKGTGQGLAIVRSVIVDKHGGRIRFESAAGYGTTFIIHLPLGENVPVETITSA